MTKTTPAEAPTPVTPHSPKGIILLVDDEKLARMVTRRRLERLGHTILEAADGQEALEVLRRHEVDLVISDWMMPEMDGPTFCEAVKADEWLRSTHFILMTALDQPEQIAEGLSRGADDFLAKSATDQEIVARIKAGLRIRQLIGSLEDSYALIAQKQAELEAELRNAASYVKSLLPHPGEFASGIRVGWEYRPSLHLGGDLFQISRWSEEYLGLIILDMSGHGIGPALRAVSLARSFQGDAVIRRYPSCDPGEIIAGLNKENPIGEDGSYFTIWVGCLHLPTREIRYATAGHPAPVLTRKGAASQLLGSESCPVGFTMDEVPTTERVTLVPGDRLYLFSDGIYEIMSPEEKLWSREGLRATCEAVHHKPLDEAIASIMERAQAWQGQELFADDVALVGVDVES